MHIKIKIKISKLLYRILIITLVTISILFAVKYVKNYNKDQEIISKTEQTYEMLQKAYEKTLKTEKLVWEDGKMDTKIFAQAFVKNLPVEKDCQMKRFPELECFPFQLFLPRYVPGFAGDFVTKDYYRVRLKNGMGVGFKIESPTCAWVRGRCGNVYIDINGAKKGPNKPSEDIYDFGIYKDGIKVYDLEANHLSHCVYGTGIYCSAYMLKFKNRNYKSLTPKKAEKLGLKLTMPNQTEKKNISKMVTLSRAKGPYTKAKAKIKDKAKNSCKVK